MFRSGLTHCLLSLFLLGPVMAESRGTALASAKDMKARRRVDTWLVFDAEKGLDRIRQQADILTSLSVFGNPSKEWIAECHRLKIEVYQGVSGNASAFETPEQAKRTIDGYLEACKEKGYDGIDLDFEALNPDLQPKYSAFLRQVSSRLHQAHKKLSHCVGFYYGMENTPPAKIFYDPAVIGKTCDQVRVMCYDLYFAPDKGDPARKVESGFGPTSTFSWAKACMQFWLRYVPKKNLIMGLPAYSNDFPMTIKGRGEQISASKPQIVPDTPFEKGWLPYERLNQYLYRHADGSMHIFYASDADSTKAHLGTVDELGIPGIGFWHFSSVDEAMWKTVRTWLGKP